jgi:L-alanine-DL-glutamate epimerase-like enolase superfamily enzyme
MPSVPEARTRRFRRLAWGRKSSPLVKPYDLSFARLTSYESVWVYAEDDAGGAGLGEAVALPGYGWETTETVCAAIAELLDGADARNEEILVRRARAAWAKNPFAASAVMAALDLPFYLAQGTAARFALNAPVSAEVSLAQFRTDAARWLDLGFPYIKVKVGGSLEANTAAARAILREFPDRQFQVVFDANQGFSLADAMRFADFLADYAAPRLLWFEQPVDRADWPSMEKLCRAARAPILLDECIYDAANIARAAAMGAFGVKLKLFKNFGIAETLALARRARAAGLTVVFGNGVATDIGNLGEYLTLATADGLFAPPAESNGFAKLQRSLLGGMLETDAAGRMTCVADAEGLRGAIARFARNAGIGD